MNCQGCQNQYNETDRSPRLLISCGHSICEKCTAELYRDGLIICPECRFKNIAPMVTCFPRNLALINMNKNATLATPAKPITSNSNIANTATTTTTTLGVNNNNQFSQSHLLNSNATQLYVNPEMSQLYNNNNNKEYLPSYTNQNMNQFTASQQTHYQPSLQQYQQQNQQVNSSINNLKVGHQQLQQTELTPPSKSLSQQSFYPNNPQTTNTTANTANYDFITNESKSKDMTILSERFAICQKHFKKYEAYCEDDQQLLCITCILEDGHRQHSIDSIENSVQKQKQKQSDYFDLSRVQEKKAINLMQSIEANLSNLANQAQSQLQEICHFFSEIKKIINERESQLKQRVQDQLLEQENQMKQLDNYYQNHIKDINEFQVFYRQSSVMQDVEYLKCLVKSNTIMNKISAVKQIDKIEFKTIQSFFSKDSEIHALAKSILTQSSSQTQQNLLNSLPQSESKNSLLTQKKQLVSNSSQNQQQQQQNSSSQSNNSNNQINNNGQTNNSLNSLQNAQIGSQNNTSQSTQKKQTGTNYQAQANKNNNLKRVSNRKDGASIGPISSNAISSNIYRTKSNQIMHKKDQNKDLIGITAGNNNNQNNNHQLQVTATTGNLNAQNYNQKIFRNDRSTSSTNPQTLNSELNKPLNNYHEMRNILKEKLTQQNNNESQNINNNNYNRGEKSSLTPSKRISNFSNGIYQNDNLSFFNKDKNIPPNISPLRSNNITNMQGQNQNNNQQYKQSYSGNNNNEGLNLNSKVLYGGQNNGYQYNDKQQQQQQQSQEYTQQIQQQNEQQQTSSRNQMSGQYNQIQQDNNDDQNFQFIDSIPETMRREQLRSNLLNPMNNYLGSANKSNNNSNTNSITNSHNLVKSNKNDVTDMFMNRCDFSTITTYQTGSYIYVFGGFIESSQYTIERFDIQRNLWESVDNLPTNRAKFSIVPLDNGNILILGGKQDGMRIALCEEYDPKQNKLSISTMMLSVPKSGFGAVNIGKDKIIVVGGNDGQTVQDTVELYDKNSQRLPKRLCNMIEKRDELAVTFGLDKKIYAIGGFGGSKNICLRSAERYDPENDRWESIANLNVPRRALAAITLPDGIYAIGGFDGTNYLSSVEKYDESLNQWIFISSMNFPRCTLSAVTSKDNLYIYVLGGFDNGPLDTVERYNVLEDKWEMYSRMSYKRFMHSSIMVTGQFI